MKPSHPLFYSTFSTPLGRFSAAVDGRGALVPTAFGGLRALAARIRGGGPSGLVRDAARLSPARAQIGAYFEGRRRHFSIPLAPAGTPFQRKVWAALRRIPFGRTRSYGELARELRTSARAVGRANATNPLCLVVPCHRVIGADGSLTGFAFGEEIKRRLLARESPPTAGPRRTPRA